MPFTACTALQQHTVVRISKSSCDVITRCFCFTIAGGLPQSLLRYKMQVMLSEGLVISHTLQAWKVELPLDKYSYMTDRN